MSLVKKVTGLFSVGEDEVKSFRLLFLQSLFIGFAISYYYIVSSSFLLKTVDIKILPTAYIVTGTAGFLIIQQYKRLQRKYGVKGSFKTSLIVFAIVCLLNFFAMKEVGTHKEFAVLLAYVMVLFAAPFTAIFSLGVFAQCSRLYNISQSKRLLALVVSGEIVSSIVAFASVSFLGPLVKTQLHVLLPVAGFFILLVFIPFNRLLNFANDKLTPPLVKRDVKVNFDFFRRDKFYMLVGITTFFSVFAIYAVDYSYLLSVRHMAAKDLSLEIPQIVAVFFVVLKVGELSTSFISGKVLSNKGVLFSLLLLPVLLLVLSSFAFAASFLPSVYYIFLLAFLFVSKIAERAIRKSVTTPSVKVMYQVAEPHERLEMEVAVDGTLNQLATILSGVLLLAASYLFFKDDIYPLLQVFSFIGIVAFAGWSLFSLKMYNSYRIKVKDFLSNVKNTKLTNKGSVGATAQADEKSLQDDDMNLDEKVAQTIGGFANINKDGLMKLIKIYNPRQSLELMYEKEEKVVKRLVHVFYSNNHYFSRLLIARYLQFCDDERSLLFLEDVWNVADIIIRLELMMSFNEKKHRIADRAFFERAIEDCVKEIAWTESAIYDTSVLHSEELETGLGHHRKVLIALLFELLKPIYDASVIKVISQIILSESTDIESELFAVELIDLTLDPRIKRIVKPILEPVTFETKKQKLGKFFYIYHLPPFERLVDILMKDYNLVNLRLKETVLNVYNKQADGRAVLSAFRTNNIENLRYKAEGMYSGFYDPVYYAKLEVLKKIEQKYPDAAPYSPYLINYGLTAHGQNKRGVAAANSKAVPVHQYVIELTSSTNISVKLDYLGLCLLLMLRQKNTGRGLNEQATALPEVEMA